MLITLDVKLTMVIATTKIATLMEHVPTASVTLVAKQMMVVLFPINLDVIRLTTSARDAHPMLTVLLTRPIAKMTDLAVIAEKKPMLLASVQMMVLLVLVPTGTVILLQESV
jgi:hypothetical protein